MTAATAATRKGPAMEKILCYGSLAVAILVLLMFLLDVIAGLPFGGGPFFVVDILGVLASAIVIYLAINVMKDLK
ncbi:MAG: hypothetical protein NZ703_01480 [Gemmataceae bacterium]|nr:hypothetical protein [Gemmataceae bacterium]MCS7269729.1 hypothetical protein [Gemmataceae bacterium]MDW8244467.1 hypothetical protein [Thermogemmata sp.]